MAPGRKRLRLEVSHFIEKVKSELGFKAAHRDVIEANGSYASRELPQPYGLKSTGENEVLRTSKHLLLG